MLVKGIKKVRKHGYTFIEIVVALGLFSLLTLIGASMVVTIFLNNKKVEVIKSLRQEGNYALTTIEGLLLNAREAECEGGKLKINDINFQTTEINCNNERVASNSAYLTSSSTIVSDCNFQCLPVEGQDENKTGWVIVSFKLQLKNNTDEPGKTSSLNFSSRYKVGNY